MKFTRIFFAALFTATAFSVSTVSAQLDVVQEHVIEFTTTPTPWELSVNVPYYDPADHNGAPLEEIMVILDGQAKSDVDITANGGDVLVLDGGVGAFISASGFMNGLTIDVIPMGKFAPPSVLVPANTMVNLTDVDGADTDMLIMSGQENVSPFEGTGNFGVTLVSMATSSLSTSGGNMDASQRTISQGTLTVQYKAVAVPEPASFVFLALASIGMAMLRRRF